MTRVGSQRYSNKKKLYLKRKNLWQLLMYCTVIMLDIAHCL